MKSLWLVVWVATLVGWRAEAAESAPAAVRLRAAGQAIAFQAVGVLNADARGADRGTLNDGVYRTTAVIAGHSQIFKLARFEAFSRSEERLRCYVDTHERLAAIGLTPRLTALIQGDGLSRRLHESGAAHLGVEAGFHPQRDDVGLLMDEVPQAHALSRLAAPPAFMAAWGVPQLQQALREVMEIQRRLRLARIFPADQQLVVTQDAHVWLIDVDAATSAEAGVPVTVDFELEVLKLCSDWEAMSGKRVPPAAIQTLLKRMAAPVSGVCPTDANWRETLGCASALTARAAQ